MNRKKKHSHSNLKQKCVYNYSKYNKLESTMALQQGILTRDEIKELNLISFEKKDEPLEKQEWEVCFSNASYDFRIGEFYAVPPKDVDDLKGKIRQASKIVCPHRSRIIEGPQAYSCRYDNYVIRIPAFASIVFSTYEKVILPNNIAGRFDLRIKWALQGLILQVGAQIEPGYEGRLFGLLHNLSNKEICIPFKERLLTAEFSYTSRITQIKQLTPEDKKKFDSLEGYLQKYNIIRGALEYVFEELDKTKEKIDKGYSQMLEGDRFKKSMGLAIIVMFASVLLSIGFSYMLSRYSVERDDYPFQKVYDVEQKIESYKVREKELMDKIIDLEQKINNIGSNQQIKKK